ncbi:tRNA (adenine(37)-N6)-methyltransferase isoform X2 [Ornithorhynchus anatinus]|uniref:tRNA (adenine(37)-N6)-methyltransferase isoform X2 n=1 Tax=Ornithorhynchus anatinus TaxID=9258 RepID=UPI0010A7B0F0|nr:tRNA (adenine(37)-N6)-methyltransferase isoform X2 [Ornithorhynchus anatinus]
MSGPCGKAGLETGNIFTEPVGFIESCFSAKNGTPRQPSVCSSSRACLRIRKDIFNNPEHSLMGLEQFSHVWILFVFHKNGHLSRKAKVQPPRLNGAKTGVFSTRSPHRPNAIGLTLAKLEKVEGGVLYLSGIDMINDTPVLDVKPYIAEYDSPKNVFKPSGEFNVPDEQCKQKNWPQPENITRNSDLGQIAVGRDPSLPCNTEEKPRIAEESDAKCDGSAKTIPHVSKRSGPTAALALETSSNPSAEVAEARINEHPLKGGISNTDLSNPSRHNGERAEDGEASLEKSLETQFLELSSISSVPSWVSDPFVASLHVRFTPHAEMDLEHFNSGADKVQEAKHAITVILSADPRSVYRRKHCQDRLFYFTMDRAHITCWFGDGFAEVLRIKPTEPVAGGVGGACSTSF